MNDIEEMAIELPVEEASRLRTEAARRGITVSDLIRERLGLERLDGDRPRLRIVRDEQS